MATIIESDDQLRAWALRREREAILMRLLAKRLPRALAERTRVADARGSILVLAVGAGAIGGALRQRVPDLLAELARSGWQFTEIRIRIQVAQNPSSRPEATRHLPDHTNAARLFDLASTLPDGPLKASIARWARRVRVREPRP
jgi:hypothetical protein